MVKETDSRWLTIIITIIFPPIRLLIWNYQLIILFFFQLIILIGPTDLKNGSLQNLLLINNFF